MSRRFVCMFAVLLLLLAPGAWGQTAAPWSDALDAYARQVQADWHVPGLAIAVVQNDSVAFARGYGVRRLGETEPVDADTLFAIASNSKAFTTAALAILVDEGKLNWDDRVRKHLPEFALYDPFVSDEMTVRDLVCHRSGLDTFSGDLLWYETGYTAEEILRRARQLNPTSSFRSKYGYQNLMYIAAGQVIERVSGKTWAAFVDERILTPLGMERTTTSVRDFQDNVASPHNNSGAGGSADDSPDSPLRPLPHGNVDNCWVRCGLNASVNDLARWMRLQLGRGTIDGKQIFSREQSWEMWQPQIMLPVSESQATDVPSRHFRAYGLGWVLFDYQGVKVLNHGGGLDGMISQTAIVPERNLGVVVLTNSESPASTILMYKVTRYAAGRNPRAGLERGGLGTAGQGESGGSGTACQDPRGSNSQRPPCPAPGRLRGKISLSDVR